MHYVHPQIPVRVRVLKRKCTSRHRGVGTMVFMVVMASIIMVTGGDGDAVDDDGDRHEDDDCLLYTSPSPRD